MVTEATLQLVSCVPGLVEKVCPEKVMEEKLGKDFVQLLTIAR